jgi:NAD(P)-dependent dehydrogenase (short-subunit alcohol dehydrogenase family)
MAQLAGKVAIVTGASGGIGQAIAEAYAAEGARVVLAARSTDKLDDLARAIAAAGGTALAVPTDVTREDEVLRLFERMIEAYGTLDVLVNNAGMADHTPTDELPLATWQAVVDLNLTGPFLCSREALRIMKPRGKGRIINLGSISAKVPRENAVAYTATKFGLEGMTRSIALDARKHGIAVSIVHPGSTLSGFTGRHGQDVGNPRMAAEDLAKIFVLIAAFPDNMNMLETTVLPNTMAFLGRG